MRSTLRVLQVSRPPVQLHPLPANQQAKWHRLSKAFSTTSARIPSQKNPAEVQANMAETGANQVVRPPPVNHILETAMQVKNVVKATAWYRDVFGIEPFLSNDRMSAFSLGPTTLLLFQLGNTLEDTHLPPPPSNDASAKPTSSGTIPGHGPTPPVLDVLMPAGEPAPRETALQEHFCFAVEKPEDTKQWEAWLHAKGVTLRGVMQWERGGRSVYFEDPDGNVGEVASRGIWPHY